MNDLSFRGASELANLIRNREISSRELLEHYLSRIEVLNSKLNACIQASVVDCARAEPSGITP